MRSAARWKPRTRCSTTRSSIRWTPTARSAPPRSPAISPASATGGGLALAGCFGWADVGIGRRGIATSDFGHEEAGLWLKAHSAPDVKIMTQDTAISVYAGRGYVFSPRAPLDRFLDYGRRHGATYVVVDEAEVTVVRPFLKPLLDSPPPGLTLLWTARDGHAGRTLGFAA